MKPRIIFLGKLPPPYIGPTIATRILLNSDLKNCFQIIHLDTSDHRDIHTLGKFDLVNILLPIKHYILLIWLIIRHWPKLVYLPSGQTTVSFLRDSIFIVIAKLFRRKGVCHLRGGNFDNWYKSCGKAIQWYIRFIYKFVDGQIVLGEKLKKLFDWLIPSNRIFVVPNGGDYQIPILKKKNKNPIKILYLANFVRTKGALDLLYAAPIVFEKIKEIQFIFAGTWTDKKVKQEFFEFVDSHKDIPIKVLESVYGPKKYELLGSADIFVFPTYYPNEGHPWVIVEALAAGLPIISTDRGAITESVIDGVNGFIVESRSPDQIAEKIEFLIEHLEVRKKMGRESKRLYLENFTEKRMAENLSNTLNQVLNF